MSIASPNPLRDIHRQAEAEFQNWADVEIVQTFGEPQAEYAAIRKSCGLFDLPQRGILEVTGKDRHAFLNNLLTNQTWDKAAKTSLSEGQGVYSFLLNLKGRVVADMSVLERGESTLIEMETRLIEPLRAVLDKYLFAEQVKMVSRVGELHEIALHGPGASEVLGVTIDAPLQSKQVNVLDADAVVWRDDPCGVPGYHVILPSESARHVWMSLIAQFAAARDGAKRLLRPVGWAAFNACRIEGGRPIFGIDFDGAPVPTAAPGKKDASGDDSGAGALPAETGLFDRAVSITKGCYLGQEIVARMHARGQVARQVCGIRTEGDALPIAAAQVLDEQSNTIGVITSSTISPVLSNAPICLGLVKRPYFTVGTKIRVAAEGAMREGVVVAMPFVSR